MSSEVGEIKRIEEGREEDGGEQGGGSEELKELYYPRRNGWNCPWHPLQILAWVFIMFFTISYFGFLVFYIPGAWRSIGYIVAGVLFITHISAVLVTSTMDPAEASVRRRRTRKMGGFLRAVFDRKKHAGVIENHYCNLCEVKVTSTAKHCSVCDKCVGGFDHHCIWLNTCIGSRNYRWFMVTVFSALLACVLLLIFTLCLFITFFSARDRLRYACSDHFILPNSSCDDRIRVFGAAAPDPVFPALVAVIGLVALVGVAMIGYLATFHVYLHIKGLTTYDYIILQRRLEAEKKRERETAQEAEEQGGEESKTAGSEIDHHNHCWFLRRKINRVTPSGDVEKGQGSLDRGLAGMEMADMSSSVNSVGLVNFGRTPVQSVQGSSEGDVSLDSNSTSAQQPAQTMDWMYGSNSTTATRSDDKELQKNQQQKELVESETPLQQANCSTTVAERTMEKGDSDVLSTRHSSVGNSECPVKNSDTLVACETDRCIQDLENCGPLAFMSSANSIIANEIEHSHTTNTVESDGCDQDLEQCGTLAFMSSANSNIGSHVSVERQITREGGDGTKSASSTMMCANSANASVMKPDLSPAMNQRDGAVFSVISGRVGHEETECGGEVALSANTESCELQERRYEMMIKSGNTVGLSTLRQLSSSEQQLSTGKGNSATAVCGFSNPLSGNENSPFVGGLPVIQGRLRPSHLARQPFPLPVQVPLTAQPRFPMTDQQTLSAPALL